ncbi:MAG: phosphatidylglycerophosphatase B [Pelotomaculum sp. PtaB.Bin013]|uniref:Phosphatase PAP2 family protein n=1 Tax=Pelotomaculum isophthalicicum JI TaxID=947010 RepID=A0A9X4JUB8_9FIRM|nr:phosphatase PAP2 family protein [Pelotomaculum isophthalicicum]MDF9408890.1 phosphatase PAP2 family protein [Pelotomaculum isophthalicicum JI]OPX86068.1 MAG: phosphatidylglycerophosphatase B [Pelotomaculum sp. PtaB.Bin013]
MLSQWPHDFSYHSLIEKFGKHLTWGIVASSLLLVLFANLAEDLLEQELGTFDASITNFVQSYATERLTSLAIVITQLGSAFVEITLLLVVGGYLIFRLKHIWETVALTSSLAGGWVLNILLKDIFHRSRPDIRHLVEAGGYSFPSGHAMVSAAFYGMLGYLLWMNLRERSKQSWYVIVLTCALILAIGISRIYLGVHFPSDVVAGFAAGGIWLAACIASLHTIRCYKN